MGFGDCITDAQAAQDILKALPVGRRVYQPSTGRTGFIVNQHDHNMAPDGSYTEPWHQSFYQQMDWKITLEGDEAFTNDLFPEEFPFQKVLQHSYLHWGPTFYRGATMYRTGDPQLPKRLIDHPQKMYTAKQAARKYPAWASRMQLDSSYTIFLTSDEEFEHPLFLGNTFWPGSPNLPCMFDYCVDQPPSRQILAQLCQLVQHFAVTDYDAANTSKEVDTLYKDTMQRCLLRGLDYDAEAAGVRNDDLVPPPLVVDAELEELVDLAMRAHAAEVAAGKFTGRVEAAAAAAADDADAATDAAEDARQPPGGAATVATLPVVDELKYLHQLSTRGFEMPAALEVTRRSGLVPQFTRGDACLAPPDGDSADRPRGPRKLANASRTWALDLGRVHPRLSRRFRRDVLRKGWKAVLAQSLRLAGAADSGAADVVAAGEQAPVRKAAARKKAGAKSSGPHDQSASESLPRDGPAPTATSQPAQEASAPRASAADAKARALGADPTAARKPGARPNARA